MAILRRGSCSPGGRGPKLNSTPLLEPRTKIPRKVLCKVLVLGSRGGVVFNPDGLNSTSPPAPEPRLSEKLCGNLGSWFQGGLNSTLGG